MTDEAGQVAVDLDRHCAVRGGRDDDGVDQIAQRVGGNRVALGDPLSDLRSASFSRRPPPIGWMEAGICAGGRGSV